MSSLELYHRHIFFMYGVVLHKEWVVNGVVL